MNEAVDVAVETNEDTEIGNRLDDARNLVALLEFFSKAIPWVLEALLNTERDTTTLFVDIKNHYVYFLPKLDNF